MLLLGKCAITTSLKTSGLDLSLYYRQKILLVEDDRLETSETFSMLYIGCFEPDHHGELCQRNTVRGKLYILDSGISRKEDILLLSLSFLPYRLIWTSSCLMGHTYMPINIVPELDMPLESVRLSVEVVVALHPKSMW